MSCLLIIPAYEPSAHLVDIVTETLNLARARSVELKALVINDGSSADCDDVFKSVGALENVTVLEQPENRGKGAALKLGFNYALQQPADQVSFVVTADADGQHLPADILAVAQRALETGRTVLGVRQFDGSVPLRSRFGNVLTRQVFRLIHGVDIEDTQTGLRAIQRQDLSEIGEISYNRYEYEIEMLTALVNGRPVEQITIETVYEPGNPTSHFNPIADSLRIYWVLLRYVLTTLFLSLCEAIIVVVLTALDTSILLTLIAARAFSVIVFFSVARSLIFRSSGNMFKQGALFLLLVLVNLVFLYAFVWVAETQFNVPRVVAAVIGNTCFFTFNFIIQRNFIFFDKSPRKAKEGHR